MAPKAEAQVWPGVVPQLPRRVDATLPPRPPTFRPLPAEPQWVESPAPPPGDRISQLAQQVQHLTAEVARLGREVLDLRTEVAQWRALVPVARERR